MLNSCLVLGSVLGAFAAAATPSMGQHATPASGARASLVSAPSSKGPAALQCNANLSTYCTPGTSAQGCVATISSTGIPSTNASGGFDVIVSHMPGQRMSTFGYSFAASATPWTPTSTSLRCVAVPFYRMEPANSGGATGQCDGALQVDFNTWLATHPAALGAPFAAGQTFYMQAWYRDPSAPGSANLSNGLTFTLCDGSGAPPMYIEACNLGCTSGSGGAQVSCSLLNGFVNQDIGVVFSEAVRATTLNSNSFRVVSINTGATATGSFSVDPNDPRRAIFRPSLQFDVNGIPQFGFDSNGAYQIHLDGTAQGDFGPFVSSSLGEPNATRLNCLFVANQGVLDYAPGAPSVTIFALPVGAGAPVDIAGGGVNDVQTNSTLTFEYDDVMNVGTLVHPGSGQAPFVSVQLDVDGNLGTFADRVVIAGSYSFSVDVSAKTTTVVFDPAGGFPSSGPGPTPRLVVVSVPSAVTDLVGNGVSNPGAQWFTPQQ